MMNRLTDMSLDEDGMVRPAQWIRLDNPPLTGRSARAMPFGPSAAQARRASSTSDNGTGGAVDVWASGPSGWVTVVPLDQVKVSGTPVSVR